MSLVQQKMGKLTIEIVFYVVLKRGFKNFINGSDNVNDIFVLQYFHQREIDDRKWSIIHQTFV